MAYDNPAWTKYGWYGTERLTPARSAFEEAHRQRAGRDPYTDGLNSRRGDRNPYEANTSDAENWAAGHSKVL